MTLCARTNSVFLPCENDEEKFKPMVTSGPPSYNPKVMIHDWQLHSLIEPRDNKTGNFRYSTYKRMGMDDEPTGISVTREMTEQIHTKKDYDEEYRYRSLLNFYSFPLTETENWKEALKFTDLDFPKSIEKVDYSTTLRDDFPSHFPEMSKAPKESDFPDAPWLMYRRTLGYNNHDLERISGVRKFLDDDLTMQIQASALKLSRFASFDPALGKYTDPIKFRDTILKNSPLKCP